MLNIHVCNASEIERMIVDNEIDLAIVDNISRQTKFESRFLYSEKMCVVCSPDLHTGKMTIADLHTKPLLLREKGSGTRISVESAFIRHGVTPVPYTESISTLSLVHMAKNGLGYAILPRKTVEEEPTANSLEHCVLSIKNTRPKPGVLTCSIFYFAAAISAFRAAVSFGTILFRSPTTP